MGKKKSYLFEYLVCHLSFHLVTGQSYQVPLQLLTSKERRLLITLMVTAHTFPQSSTAEYRSTQIFARGPICSCTTISLLDKEE